MWYMNCTVRYSNNSIFGVMQSKPMQALSTRRRGVSNVSEFNEVLKTLLYDLRVKAAAGGIYRKIANENANYQNNTVYGLMQCSPDLSEIDCSNCLVGAQNELLKCCSENEGTRILFPSCNLRIESNPFFGTTLVASPPPLSPPPPAKGTFPDTHLLCFSKHEFFFFIYFPKSNARDISI